MDRKTIVILIWVILTSSVTRLRAVAIQQRCNVCLADSGLGDDVALCNIIQTQKACLPNKGIFPNLGTTHCYTIAGRYKYLNGSKDIHTGIARGCIDCTDKAAACATFTAAFNAQPQNWTLLDVNCNMECCTGDNCNNQNVTVIPATPGYTTTPAPLHTTTSTNATPTSNSHAPTSVMPSVTPTSLPECSNYKFLNESNRARTFNDTAIVLCDTSLSGWYRFSGGAGNQMAESCVAYKHCAADATGWLSGGHPAVADGAVGRKVCFSGRTKCCSWSIDISIRNCGGFYVYQLRRPPHCNFRYCGNGISSTPASTTIMPPAKTPTPTPSSASTLPSVTPKIPTPTPSSVCPHLLTLKETSGVITSPKYPNKYPGNQACSWQITASRGKRIKLVIEAMYIQQCRACTCDYLEIQNGSFADGTPSERECGILFGNVTYYSNTESLIVLFVSDKSVQMRGFRASYTQFNYTASIECSNYRFLNESNRAITFFNLSISYLCDTTLTAGWYRFSGGAGNQMADTCVASHINYCGTDAHGWLSGSHPVVAEGAVRRKVCYPNFGACCPFSNYISVRNCGLFFVYKLQPPAHCFLRYCGNGFPQAPECYNYKFLNESSRVRSYNKSTPSCSDTALSGWYRFSGEAGNQMADSCVSRSHCGAMLPGWLSGGHPKVEEGVVQRKVCFTANSCCHSSIYTSVRNCGLFYVYKLTPLPACNLRYCGSEVLPPTTISPVPGSSSASPSTVPASSSASSSTAKPTAPITNATRIEPTTREFDPSKVNIENKNYVENAIGEIGCPVMLKSIDVSSQCIKVVTESAY